MNEEIDKAIKDFEDAVEGLTCLRPENMTQEEKEYYKYRFFAVFATYTPGKLSTLGRIGHPNIVKHLIKTLFRECSDHWLRWFI